MPTLRPVTLPKPEAASVSTHRPTPSVCETRPSIQPSEWTCLCVASGRRDMIIRRYISALDGMHGGRHPRQLMSAHDPHGHPPVRGPYGPSPAPPATVILSPEPGVQTTGLRGTTRNVILSPEPGLQTTGLRGTTHDRHSLPRTRSANDGPSWHHPEHGNLMIVSIDAAYFALPGFEGQAATHPRLLCRHPLRGGGRITRASRHCRCVVAGPTVCAVLSTRVVRRPGRVSPRRGLCPLTTFSVPPRGEPA